MEITEEQLRTALQLAESMHAINFVAIKFEIKDTILIVTQTFRVTNKSLPYFGMDKDLGVYERTTEINQNGDVV